MKKIGVKTDDGTVVFGDRAETRHICDGCGEHFDGPFMPRDWFMVDGAPELDYCGACARDWPKVGSRFIALEYSQPSPGRHLAVVR